MKRVYSILLIAIFAFSCGEQKEEVHQGYSDTADQYEVDGVVVSNVDINAKLWNPRGKTEEQHAERAEFLIDAYNLKRTDEQKATALKYKEKYKDAIYINSLMIGGIGVVGTEEEHFAKGLKRNFDAGATVVSVTIYAYPSDGTIPPLERMKVSKKIAEDLGYTVATDVKTIRKAKEEGRMVVVFNTQGADYAIEDLNLMGEAKSYGLGVSNFTYNNDNALAGGGDKQTSGVTELGRQWIKKMNELGIVVDCSHASNQTAIDAATHSAKPIVASHSNPSAIMELNRNLSDEAIIAVGKSGGVVCNVGVGIFMNEEGDATPERLVEHILYTAKLIGREKVGYATDFMHCFEPMFKASVNNTEIFPPEKGYGAPATNIGTEHIWDIVAVLEDTYGWSDTEIKGFLGENLLRVYAANWK